MIHILAGLALGTLAVGVWALIHWRIDRAIWGDD